MSLRSQVDQLDLTVAMSRKATTRPGGQVANLLGGVGREADEGPTIGPSGIPNPQLGIEDDVHEFSLADRADSPRALLQSC